MRIDRRQFVLGVIGSGTFSTFLAGCGGGKPNGGGTASTGTPSKDEGPVVMSLTFSETEAFYDQLSKAIESKQNVVLTFDGKHRVGENSKLLTEFIGKATNWEELWKEFKEKDTEAGRRELERVFTAELLNHKALKDDSRVPNGEVKLPSGEVIEPTTVILVLGIILILAATSVAHAESARGRRYRIAIREPKTGFELYFQGEP